MSWPLLRRGSRLGAVLSLGCMAACGEPVGITAPTLAIVAPSPNDTVLSGEAVTFRVDVTDAAAPWEFTLEWATAWGRVIAGGDSAVGHLPDTGTYDVVVLARQGAEVLASDRVTLTVLPNAAPVVAIEPIAQPCLVYVTDTVRLVAHATDPESAARIEWRSSLGGVIGTGDTLQWVLGSGAEGLHVIAARALDPEGNVDVALTTVRVLGGPRFRWARYYPASARPGTCGGARGAGSGISFALALADDGTVVAGMTPLTRGESALWSLTATGDVRWRFATVDMATEHWAALVLAPDGTAFFANIDSVLHAIRSDGTVSWSAPAVLGRDFHGRFALAPDGALFLSGRAPNAARYHDLVRVDPATGAELWRLRGARDGGRSSVAVLADGQLMQTSGWWAVRATPAGAIARIDSTAVFFGYSQYGMSAFDAAGVGYHPRVPSLVALSPDHTVQWEAYVSAAEPVVGADGALYAAGNGVARVAPDGQTQWSAPVAGGAAGADWRLALLADGTLWVGGGRFLTRLDAATGARLDQVEFADDLTSALAVAADGTLYAITGWNRLVAIDAGAPLDPNAPWPTWRRDNRRTSSVPRP